MDAYTEKQLWKQQFTDILYKTSGEKRYINPLFFTRRSGSFVTAAILGNKRNSPFAAQQAEKTDVASNKAVFFIFLFVKQVVLMASKT